jgi:pimeloyl-ACP methyl ester carboxylesterase
MATFVLVHGGFHGGWCWQRVARRLRAAGHDVHTPTMTGHGERSHLRSDETGLDLNITDVVNVLEYEDLGDVILVGHSYGGMVVTGVTDRVAHRVRHLVYLDAAMPLDGESLVDLSPGPIGSSRQGSVVLDGVEVLTFDPAALAHLGVVDADDVAFVGPRLTPQAWRTFADPIHLTAPDALAAVPFTIIDCVGSPSLGATRLHPGRKPGAAERVAAAAHALEIDAGHDAMVTEPERVVELLARCTLG